MLRNHTRLAPGAHHIETPSGGIHELTEERGKGRAALSSFPEDIMLNDSERFAFSFTTVHIFTTSGNAYDATMTSDRINTGDILIIPTERIVGIAHSWPIAVTAETGNLHSVDGDRNALDAYCDANDIPRTAVSIAALLAKSYGYPIDPRLSDHS